MNGKFDTCLGVFVAASLSVACLFILFHYAGQW